MTVVRACDLRQSSAEKAAGARCTDRAATARMDIAMRKEFVFMLLLPVAACSSGSGNSGVSESACNGVSTGESRADVNAALGAAGGGGGNSSSCAVWWGSYDSGPCCSVRLTDCTAGGTVTSVAYAANGCASSGSSGGSSGGSVGGLQQLRRELGRLERRRLLELVLGRVWPGLRHRRRWLPGPGVLAEQERVRQQRPSVPVLQRLHPEQGAGELRRGHRQFHGRDMPARGTVLVLPPGRVMASACRRRRERRLDGLRASP